MKGIILAGGFGTRLHPTTKAVNKHLLPVYDKPMIYYPLETLIEAGVEKIAIVTNPENIANFVNLLGSGEAFRELSGKPIQIVYMIQNYPSGIADGLWVAKDYVGSESCVLMLGDNVFEYSDEIKREILSFKGGATIFVKEVSDPHRFGIAEVGPDNTVISLEEKPQNPKSNLAVTGVYIYDNTCFAKCVGQPKSERGEYEITYINDLYRKENALKAIPLSGKWFDTGTFDSILVAGNFMQQKKHENPAHRNPENLG